MNLTSLLANRVFRRPNREPGTPTRYRPTHRSLLVDVSRQSVESPGLTLGGIVLPTSRPLDEGLPGLELAVELARERDCQLLLICSKKARPSDFSKKLAAELGDRLILVNQARVHAGWKPQLESARERLGRFHRDNDAAEKRNLGLALAAVFKWSSVLFMDDDISPSGSGPTLDGPGLDRALAALDCRPDLRAVGWSAVEMDDHSVVGHSRKLVRMEQDVFVGAGALLVRSDQRTPYFPNVYNHDWIFLIMLAKWAPDPQRAIGWAGTVAQLPYDPYVPKRARSEEAGEVIGECLMNLLEDHGANFAAEATAGFWAQALAHRHELVIELHRLVGRRIHRSASRKNVAAENSELYRVRRALGAALEVNRDLTAADLVGYLGILDQDEIRWEDHLRALAQVFTAPPDLLGVMKNLQSGRAPALYSRRGVLSGPPAHDTISLEPAGSGPNPNSRPTESDALAVFGEEEPPRRLLRWPRGLDVHPRRSIMERSSAPPVALQAAGADPRREAAGIG